MVAKLRKKFSCGQRVSECPGEIEGRQSNDLLELKARVENDGREQDIEQDGVLNNGVRQEARPRKAVSVP